MRFEGTDDYVATDDLKVAVNAAVTLRRPLLVKGEPGTGKTVLAHEIARSLGADDIRCKRQVFSAGGEEWDGLLWQSTSRDAKAVATTEPPPAPVLDALPASLMQPLRCR